MKVVVIAVAVAICHVVQIASETIIPVKKNDGEVPNPDIMTVLVNILHRMDRMEEKMTLSTDATKRLENTVQTNSKILTQLDSHMKLQQKKTEDIDKMRIIDEKRIEDNSKSIKNLAVQNQALFGKIKYTTEKVSVVDQKSIGNTNAIEKITVHENEVSKILNHDLKKIREDVTEIKEVFTKAPPGKTKSTPADSCSTLNEHHYYMKSGKYWVKKQGKVLFEYCKMDDAGIPPEPRATLQVEILGVGHASNTTGQYFNFMRQSIPGLAVGRAKFFNATNPRTGMSGEVVVWGATNGGSTGDAHGRFNYKPLRPQPGQWTRGDILVLFM